MASFDANCVLLATGSNMWDQYQCNQLVDQVTMTPDLKAYGLRYNHSCASLSIMVSPMVRPSPYLTLEKSAAWHSIMVAHYFL